MPVSVVEHYLSAEQAKDLNNVDTSFDLDDVLQKYALDVSAAIALSGKKIPDIATAANIGKKTARRIINSVRLEIKGCYRISNLLAVLDSINYSVIVVWCDEKYALATYLSKLKELPLFFYKYTHTQILNVLMNLSTAKVKILLLKLMTAMIT